MCAKNHTSEKLPSSPPSSSKPPPARRSLCAQTPTSKHRAHMCFYSVGETKWSQMYLGSPQQKQ